MITIENLTISYSKNKTIIHSLNISMLENTINGIVGLNGSGKTTLLNAIYGLKGIDEGKIEYKGTRVSKQQIAYLVTENYFYSGITGREFLSLFKNNHFDLTRWNELFLLPLDQLIDEYSTGMKKKLALLSILKQDKPILVLDEPFNGLDLETCRIIRTILMELKAKSRTIIITSHIIETLTNLCDNLYYLENGTIKYSVEKKDFEAFEHKLFHEISQKNDFKIKEIIENGYSNY